MAAKATNKMEVSVKRCPCLRRGSFICAKAFPHSWNLGSSFSIPLAFRHFWMASVYFICLFFFTRLIGWFHLILSKKRFFVISPCSCLERISPTAKIRTCSSTFEVSVIQYLSRARSNNAAPQAVSHAPCCTMTALLTAKHRKKGEHT